MNSKRPLDIVVIFVQCDPPSPFMSTTIISETWIEVSPNVLPLLASSWTNLRVRSPLPKEANLSDIWMGVPSSPELQPWIPCMCGRDIGVKTNSGPWCSPLAFLLAWLDLSMEGVLCTRGSFANVLGLLEASISRQTFIVQSMSSSLVNCWCGYSCCIECRTLCRVKRTNK